MPLWSEKLQTIATQLKEQQEAYLKLQDNYRQLQQKTIDLLSAIEQFEQPIILDVPATDELDQIEEQLEESNTELSEKIEKISED